MAEQIRVFKIGDDGRIVFSMPDMIGRYVVIEQRDGQIIISPYDLRTEAPYASIAKLGSRLHFVQTGDVFPVA